MKMNGVSLIIEITWFPVCTMGTKNQPKLYNYRLSIFINPKKPRQNDIFIKLKIITIKDITLLRKWITVLVFCFDKFFLNSLLRFF